MSKIIEIGITKESNKEIEKVKVNEIPENLPSLFSVSPCVTRHPFSFFGFGRERKLLS